jgi:hypothetical protein
VTNLTPKCDLVPRNGRLRVIALTDGTVTAPRPNGEVRIEQGDPIPVEPRVLTAAQVAAGWRVPAYHATTNVVPYREVPVVHPQWALWEAEGLITTELLADVAEPWNAGPAKAAAIATADAWLESREWTAPDDEATTIPMADLTDSRWNNQFFGARELGATTETVTSFVFGRVVTPPMTIAALKEWGNLYQVARLTSIGQYGAVCAAIEAATTQADIDTALQGLPT